VVQPKLPKATWEVTKLEEGRGFDWTARGMGITSVGGHWIEPAADGGSLVRLSVDSSGWPTYLIGWWMERKTIEYVRMEAAGLKARIEGTGA
jgi:hypothetical protein